MSSSALRSRPRAVWVDPRLWIGIVIVIISIAGVWFVVAAARQTTPVLIAARTLVAGETIASGDLRVVEVALGQAQGGYAAPGAIGEGAVALRTVSAGELLPTAAVGTADAVRTTTVVIPSSTGIPAAVVAGAAVEVWSAPRGTGEAPQTPRILVADAVVARVIEKEALGVRATQTVEVVVPRAALAEVLAALADEAMLSVVPIGGAP